MAERIYISGPITGVADYQNKFKAAERLLRSKGYEVVNPTKLDGAMPQLDYEDYMEIDLALVRMCQSIYMLNGWKNSRGARREYEAAKNAGLTVIEQKDNPGPWRNIEDAVPPDDGMVLVTISGKRGNLIFERVIELAAFTDEGWILWKDLHFCTLKNSFTVHQWAPIPEGYLNAEE